MEHLYGGSTRESTTSDPLVSPDTPSGLEEFITSEHVLGLLGIPEEGILRISSALLIAGEHELCAYWWRDEHTGKQTVELRDPVLVKAAFSNTVIDSGYVIPNVIRLGVGNGVQWMAVYVPPAHYSLIVLDEQQVPRRLTLGLPGLIFAGRGSSYWMWAVKERTVSPHMSVYHVPLPNIGESGTLCYGTNTPPKADGLAVMQAFHLFMDSPFNNHWAIGKALSHPGDVRMLLSSLAEGSERPEFPLNDLVPVTPHNQPDQPLTLDDLFTHVILRR